MNLLLATLAAPLATAAVGAIPGPRRPKEAVFLGGLAATFVLALATAGRYLAGEMPAAFGGALRVDGLSALVLVLTAFVGLLSGLYSVGYLERNERSGFVSARQRTELLALVPAYLVAMLLVAVSNNLGVLWIAVEATTIASVFLVAFQNRDTSLEAAWKFLVLGSVGLAFALLGTVLLFASGQGVLGEEMSALDWTRLLAHAGALHPFTVKLAVVFLVVGYGTKAGLAPMHTWKPDAYREAPSPAGVLMAVGMMNCALYALLRVHVVSRAVAGAGVLGPAPPRPGAGLRARRDALHPHPVEPQAPARLLERRARGDHGDRLRARGGDGHPRGAPAHDLPHVRQAGRVLLRGHARPAPPLLRLRRDRRGHALAAPPSRAACCSSPP